MSLGTFWALCRGQKTGLLFRSPSFVTWWTQLDDFPMVFANLDDCPGGSCECCGSDDFFVLFHNPLNGDPSGCLANFLVIPNFFCCNDLIFCSGFHFNFPFEFH